MMIVSGRLYGLWKLLLLLLRRLLLLRPLLRLPCRLCRLLRLWQVLLCI